MVHVRIGKDQSTNEDLDRLLFDTFFIIVVNYAKKAKESHQRIH